MPSGGNLWENPSRKDIASMGRSLKQGWLTDPEKRQEIIGRLVELALSEDTQPRSRIAAAKALLAADRVEQGWAEIELKKKAMEGGNNVNVLAVVADLQAHHGNGSGPVALEVSDD